MFCPVLVTMVTLELWGVAAPPETITTGDPDVPPPVGFGRILLVAPAWVMIFIPAIATIAPSL